MSILKYNFKFQENWKIWIKLSGTLIERSVLLFKTYMTYMFKKHFIGI